MGHEIKVQAVDRKGGTQFTITIPRPIAEAWGLKKGDTVDLSFEDGKMVIRKKTK